MLLRGAAEVAEGEWLAESAAGASADGRHSRGFGPYVRAEE
jgi:hypothetical protein